MYAEQHQIHRQQQSHRPTHHHKEHPIQIDQDILQQFSQSDPKQLKQVIEALITKSRLLIQSLQSTWQKLQSAEAEKVFWKDSYFHLREACQHYVECSGLTPFNYIASLEEELKKEKVYKSCLEEKFKVMQPKLSTMSAKDKHKELIATPSEHRYIDLSPQKVELNQSQQQAEMNKSNSSTFMVRESNGEIRYQNKHKIGPKNIEFFKFREQKAQQEQ